MVFLITLQCFGWFSRLSFSLLGDIPAHLVSQCTQTHSFLLDETTFYSHGMSVGVERERECEVVGQAGRGCNGMERGRDCEAVGGA